MTNRSAWPSLAAGRRLWRELYALAVTTATLAACVALGTLEAIRSGWLASNPVRRAARAAETSYVDFSGDRDPRRAGRRPNAVLSAAVAGADVQPDRPLIGIAALAAAAVIGIALAVWVLRSKPWRKTADRAGPNDLYHRYGYEEPPPMLPPVGARPAQAPGVEDMPPDPEDDEPVEFRQHYELTLNGVPVSIRLDPVASGDEGDARVVWAAEPTEIPAEGAFVCLGESHQGFLRLDLASAPGVVAVGGDPVTAVQLVELMLEQLDHVPAVVIGPAADGLAELPRVRRIDSLGQLDARSSDDTTVRLVVWSPPAAMRAQTLEFLLAGGGERVVPLILGEVPDAPWQIDIKAGAPTGRHTRRQEAPEPDQVDTVSA